LSVTVLLPVYNGAGTLRQALDSILAQDLTDFELLVVDDASTDASAAVIREYAERDDRITAVLHERNLGLAATLNEGLRVARHELVARMDQDDEALPARLRVQQAFMAEHQSVVAAGSYVLHMGRTRAHDRLVELPRTPREVARVLPRENCLYHPSVVLRRTAVLAAGGYRGEFKNAEDYELWLRLARIHDLANVPQALLRYRFSLGGMTLSRKWEQLYYVHLAQEMNRHIEVLPDEAARRAHEVTRAFDRRRFMTQVARGTATELSRLGLAQEALQLISGFAQEIGPIAAARLATSVLAERLRPATARVRPPQPRARPGVRRRQPGLRHAGPIRCVVFSLDRAMQLDAFLESINTWVPDLYEPLVVLYRASTPAFAAGYETLRRARPYVQWVEEESFRDDLLGVVGSESLLAFHTDDDVFFAEVPEFALAEDEVCFTLRLGLNTTYSYPLDTEERLEQPEIQGDRVAWNWREQSLGTFSYPLALNGHVFRGAEARDWLARVDYSNPNELESVLQTLKDDLRPRMASFTSSRVVSIPANIVNATFRNRQSGRYGVAELNDRFLSGERIALDQLDFSAVTACHQEIPYAFRRETSTAESRQLRENPELVKEAG
jgi:hypothetical protein